MGDLGLIPELGRSPGEGKGYPLQCSGLENSMDQAMGSQRVGHDWYYSVFNLANLLKPVTFQPAFLNLYLQGCKDIVLTLDKSMI